MRRDLDVQLDRMNQELVEMGSVCEKNITGAFKALQDHDRELAMEIFKSDYDVSDRARTIERLCLSLILRQQPVASDLRQVSALLKMISDLERIGNQACDIAELVMQFEFTHEGEDLQLLYKMADEALKMVQASVDAYVKFDERAARAIFRMDDAVDKYFSLVKEAIVKGARVNPEKSVKISLDVLMMSKYLERIGDHACNIAKWVIYAVTGNQSTDEGGI